MVGYWKLFRVHVALGARVGLVSAYRRPHPCTPALAAMRCAHDHPPQSIVQHCPPPHGLPSQGPLPTTEMKAPALHSTATRLRSLLTHALGLLCQNRRLKNPPLPVPHSLCRPLSSQRRPAMRSMLLESFARFWMRCSWWKSFELRLPSSSGTSFCSVVE